MQHPFGRPGGELEGTPPAKLAAQEADRCFKMIVVKATLFPRLGLLTSGSSDTTPASHTLLFHMNGSTSNEDYDAQTRYKHLSGQKAGVRELPLQPSCFGYRIVN